MTVGTVNNWPNLNVTGRVDVDALTVGGVDVTSANGAAITPTSVLAESVTTDLLVLASDAPAAADSPGVAGTIAWESGFLYVCVATDTWERVEIATWV
jgi:hypothetical protein